METPVPDLDPAQDEAAKWAGLKTRALSALLLGLLFLGIVWQGGWLFHLLIIFAATIIVKEWNALTEQDGSGWRLAGMCYAAVPCASVIWLREYSFAGKADGGACALLYLLLVVWATDIGAYFAGRQFGGPKLAPTISPKKTWAGLAGGMTAAMLVGGIAHSVTPFPGSLWLCIIMGGVLAVISQAGDLFESWVKRRAGAKDSGTLIPGHGGLLDRIDGLLFAAPVFAWALAIAGMGMAEP
jgi:phosphatidate cytidylyltransferase